MKSLDQSLPAFEKLLDKTRDIIIERKRDMESAKAFSGVTPGQIREWMDEPIPDKGLEPEALLDFVKEKVVDTATMNMAPNMYAYVMAGGTQISILAEMIAVTLNQNVGKWHLAPVMTEMEQQVIKWGAEFIGYSPDAAGALVSGGSAANLTALTVARNNFFSEEGIGNTGLFAQQPFTVYASTETHNCVDKSIDLLGIGTEQYRQIPVLEDFTIDVAALRQQIADDILLGYRPFCVIGNAGTVNTGAVDPLEELAAIASEHGMWFHVDGAYGALAASVGKLKPLYKGIALADSIALDFHKWLYQPFEAGCTLVRNWEQLNKTYWKKASYLASDKKEDGRRDFNEHQFQLSRNAKALKIWMTFKAYGRQQLVDMIEKDVDLTAYLADIVDKADDFRLSSGPSLGITCFQYTGGLAASDATAIAKLNRAIIPALEADGRVFITGTSLNGTPVIRACLINHRLQKKNIDYLVYVIREVGQKVLARERQGAHQEG